MKEYLKYRVVEALNTLGIKGFVPTFEKPKEGIYGDLSCNIAMVLAKELKRSPREIASQIISQFGTSDKYISKAEIAGAGFINFFISDTFYNEQLVKNLRKGLNFGRSSKHKGKRANIEWVSANPTGPLHAGHGRHIALGKAVANLLEWAGYDVTREYYYNNAGKQMENLALSVYARYKQLFEPGYNLPENVYAGEYIKVIARSIKDEYGEKFLNTNTVPDIFKEVGESWCFESIRDTLKRLGIVHDVFFNEDTLYREGKIEKILNEFKSHELSYEKDGAVWLRTSSLIKDKKETEDKVIVKASGEPTYRLPDMAYHIDKLKRGYDLLVDIFGADHSDTYKEVLAGVKGLGYDISRIKVIIHQMVTFVRDGKPVRMSKRSDNVYYLDELLNEVGVDVAQFFFVMRSANTHLDFDIKLAKEQSEKNPVFYLQYAHARICGILRNADTSLPEYLSINPDDIDFSVLKEPEEIEVKKILSDFPDVVENAVDTFEPHKVITYLNDTAERFHRFYHNHRVLNAETKELSYARLKLCEASKTVLQNGLNIIGVSAPERM